MNLIKQLILINCCFCCIAAKAQSNTDSLLNELNDVLAAKQTYVTIKLDKIAALKRQEAIAKTASEKYNADEQLYEEYKSFSYDSAYNYAKKLQAIAALLNDPAIVASSKMKLAFTLLSSGLFKETLEEMNGINVNVFAASDKIAYYFLKARCYFDLSDYDRSKDYTRLYDAKGLKCIDSALVICKPGSFNFLQLEGLKDLKMGNFANGEQTYSALLKVPELTPHDFAVNASCLSYIFERKGRNEASLALLIKSAIADVKSATKETFAIYKLADVLYKKGDIADSYVYIKQAMDDATFYGALQRQVRISSILPIIEAQWINQIERQKRLSYIYSFIITLLVVAVIAFTVITYRQLKKLKRAETHIKEVNANLLETNKTLEELNRNLNTANKIKNEYIGYYFNINSVYIEKLESFQKSLEKKLNSKRYDDALNTLKSLNLEDERHQLFNTFDSVFLRLFPDFVKKFNALFDSDKEIAIPAGQVLALEHRIFALIRMGIHDNDRIAKLLGYSVNTIYSYKNRIKNRSFIANDDFEKCIMQIEAV